MSGTTTTDDTIAAVATPPGEGGIGIVRLSGPDAVAIVSRLFVSSRGKTLRAEERSVYHGEIRDDTGVLDEVLVNVMPAPNSYTRENVVEINGHGGRGPLSAVLEAVLAQGARLAEPGEFTKRAFLNGRIDLAQAEAVIDRIRAGTRAALRAAGAAAAGHLSRSIHRIRDTLADAAARVEAAVDFPEDDLPELVNDALRAQLESARRDMVDLLATANAGRLYREGAAVAIVGRPNVGKSSLFNALVRDARAIVTAQPGTTRDLIEEVITISGIPVRLHDTAGLRPAADEAEKLGVERARNAFRNADAVLLVLDSAEPASPEDDALAAELDALEIPALLVMNKADLAPDAPLPAWASRFPVAVRMSATTGEHLKELEDTLGHLLLGDASVRPDQGLITRIHQRDSLRRAADAVQHVLDNFTASPEFLSVDLREALHALGEITGETTPEDLLDRIFSAFCIGK